MHVKCTIRAEMTEIISSLEKVCDIRKKDFVKMIDMKKKTGTICDRTILTPEKYRKMI